MRRGGAINLAEIGRRKKCTLKKGNHAPGHVRHPLTPPIGDAWWVLRLQVDGPRRRQRQRVQMGRGRGPGPLCESAAASLVLADLEMEVEPVIPMTSKARTL
jgi:hypothetical protein